MSHGHTTHLHTFLFCTLIAWEQLLKTWSCELFASLSQQAMRSPSSWYSAFHCFGAILLVVCHADRVHCEFTSVSPVMREGLVQDQESHFKAWPHALRHFNQPIESAADSSGSILTVLNSYSFLKRHEYICNTRTLMGASVFLFLRWMSGSL